MSTPTRQSITTAGAFARRFDLTVFFVLVFAFTWPLQVVDALGSHGVLPFRISLLGQILFVAYMPTVAALLVAGLLDGWDGVRALLRKALIWRVGFQWYAIAIFGFAFFCGAAVTFANRMSDGAPISLLARDTASLSPLQLVTMVPALFVIVTLVNGEELAWRGFALPRLQQRRSALSSSILLGFVWAAFHLPLFLTRTGPPLEVMSMISRSLQLVGASVIFTWLYNHTRGSVLLAYLLHGSVNTWTRVFPISESPPLVGWLMTGLVCLFAALIVVVFGADHLRRTGQRITEANLNVKNTWRTAEEESV